MKHNYRLLRVLELVIFAFILLYNTATLVSVQASCYFKTPCYGRSVHTVANELHKDDGHDVKLIVKRQFIPIMT